MVDSEINSLSFHLAELRSELIRVRVLLGLLASLLILVLGRGIIAFSHGHREAWPFVVLLTGAAAYEVLWLKWVNRAIVEGRAVSGSAWSINIFLESLVPTVALWLETYTVSIGPRRVLGSPVLLVYFLLIILSALHLSPVLCRLAGVFSAAGYTALFSYILVFFSDAATGEKLVAYTSAFSTAVLLLIAGLAAGAVAGQIRAHVVAALNEEKNRAKIAQLQHDLEIARSIQQGLLPKAPPEVDGFDIAGWNKPADETGGDYYDWQSLKNGQVALTIADVTGHGIGAALGMAICRSYARAELASNGGLCKVLSGLNELLCQDLPGERFVTLAAGVLDPHSATLHLISAGHGPLAFYSAREDRFNYYEAQGPPLGILQSFRYGGPQTIQFAPGDILVLVTDGLIEWANMKDEDFGKDRLEGVIRASRELYSEVRKFSESTPQLDDLTALIVKCTREPTQTLDFNVFSSVAMVFRTQ